MKTCKDCNTEKSLDAFYSTVRARGNTEYSVRCKPCHSLDSVKTARQRKTGWGREQFDAAWETQKGCCAICSKTMKDSGRSHDSVMADHCHDSLSTRALLCGSCNKLLGLAQDNPETLTRAIAYLKHHGK